ncbi:hypothetical protein [Butyricicoccus pullicaecorum]|uniref:RNA polymerase sigma-70 region 4 domain-containing protein n=1 Tax=Butyricicoccus pullicaecorum 1.2 TaxID=1203606 RepID=R8W4I5_9FIRM|nr:hypothetical protein [Butyricicoccus pullicaecorum]EOQ39624.1 hypothetical protein HMPREF1526_00318 [Butyricicoccus pullicaecorum 1.2]SKA56807.1 hypothetical protein SAMN02745978_01022 [Butyricicoccus pullicaecorum DSM 23266]
MTSKQAKEYLLRVRRVKREVQRYQALKAQARDLACSSTAPPDKLSVIGGKGGDVFARYAQYAATLDEKISDLYDLQNEVTCTIARVPDSRYRELLLGYYVEGLTWEQTAVEMGYSYQNVVQFLHPKALAQVGEIL